VDGRNQYRALHSGITANELQRPRYTLSIIAATFIATSGYWVINNRTCL